MIDQQDLMKQSQELQGKIVELFEQLNPPDRVVINCLVNMVSHAYAGLKIEKTDYMNEMSDSFDFYRQRFENIAQHNQETGTNE